MPDAIGMPTENECGAALLVCAPDDVPAALSARIRSILAAVKAEFQSPVGRDGMGGTGRNFTPALDSRTYDGTGYSRLRVDDIVPGTALAVTVYGSPITDVVLAVAHNRLGYNVLARPQYGAFGAFVQNTPYGIFPVGVQNIAVATTFGYAATVPADVYEAILGEVVSRCLSQGFVGIAGAGESVTMVDFEVNTSAGVSIWDQTAPMATMHTNYLNCLERYRDDGGWRRARLRHRMS